MALAKSKIENSGGERLFTKDEWCAPGEIQCTTAEMLVNPIIVEGFQRILEQHRPSHPLAMIGLCTSTRPYRKTPTWKAFMQTSDGRADCIINSAGGVVPIEFDTEWPYLTYNNPPHEPESDLLYIEIMTERLVKFFERHAYRKVVFCFLPGKKNRATAAALRKRKTMDVVTLPGPLLWERLTKKVRAKSGNGSTEKFKRDGYLWAPLAHPLIQDAIGRHLGDTT